MLGTTFGGNHLACAAALAVLEVIEEEKLMENAKSTGDFLISSLKKIDGLKNVRGKGLMIGFDLETNLKDLRKNLLNNQQVFTGEAKPNIIRLLPSLALRKKEAEEFLESLQEEIQNMVSSTNLVHQA
jgi:acetylornithine aminotransferase